tara:strand:+ start:410 stop:781 length:372 start_codon:yes stop_codon:yes gene_type:complete
MSKLFSILLVIVLSGCGGTALKTPLENCADDMMMFFDIKLDTLDKIILDSSREDFMNEYRNYSSVKQLGYDKLLQIAKNKKANSDFLDLSVQDKLQNRNYEQYFKGCEKERMKYPNTFDTKWL